MDIPAGMSRGGARQIDALGLDGPTPSATQTTLTLRHAPQQARRDANRALQRNQDQRTIQRTLPRRNRGADTSTRLTPNDRAPRQPSSLLSPAYQPSGPTPNERLLSGDNSPDMLINSPTSGSDEPIFVPSPTMEEQLQDDQQ